MSIRIDKSKICLKMQLIASRVSSKDLEEGLKHLHKTPADLAKWAKVITNACLSKRVQPPNQIINAAWKSHGIKIKKVSSQKKIEQACIGKGELKRLGSGFFGSVYRTSINGKEYAIKIEKLKEFRLRNIDRFMKTIEASRLAATLGVGPRIHDVYVCEQGNNYHFVMLMDLIKGPTWTQWSKTASPKEMEEAKQILQRKMRLLNQAGIIHDDLGNSDNTIIITKNRILQDVMPIDYGISFFARDGDQIGIEVLDQRSYDNWLSAFAGFLLKNHLLTFV